MIQHIYNSEFDIEMLVDLLLRCQFVLRFIIEFKKNLLNFNDH